MQRASGPTDPSCITFTPASSPGKGCPAGIDWLESPPTVCTGETPVAKNQPLIKWQLPMQRVLIAAAPLVVAAVYFFGWRTLVLLGVVTAAGFAAEYSFARSWGRPVSSAVFVTCCLYTLSLPPALPFWMAVVGIVFAAAGAQARAR